jgi:hypothetical protein
MAHHSTHHSTHKKNNNTHKKNNNERVSFPPVQVRHGGSRKASRKARASRKAKKSARR